MDRENAELLLIDRTVSVWGDEKGSEIVAIVATIL